MLVLDLLKYAATGSPSAPANQLVSPLDEVDDRQIRWVIDAGLGALLYRATRDRADRVPTTWRDALLSADITAQVRHSCQIDTAKEVIDACQEVDVPATLLKGISTSHQFYPSPHLRPMADIDVLIPHDAYETVESAILRRDYNRHPDYLPADDFHHGVPLLHSERGVWVELHTSLFPKSDSLRANSLFGSRNVNDQSVECIFQGRQARRLSDELQLVYIASSWMRDLTLSKIHPSFLISLFDAVRLLRESRETLNWNRLFGWLDNELAMASLYVMLTYLSRVGIELCAHSIVSRVASRQHLVGTLELRIMHAMLDWYLLGGRTWDLPLPPPVVGRYSLRNQLRKRWPGRLFAKR